MNWIDDDEERICSVCAEQKTVVQAIMVRQTKEALHRIGMGSDGNDCEHHELCAWRTIKVNGGHFPFERLQQIMSRQDKYVRATDAR